MRWLLALVVLAWGCKGPAADDSAPVETGDTSDTDVARTGCADVERLPIEAACSTSAPCAWTGEQWLEFYGWGIDAGADVDGDGLPDLAIGAPWHDHSSDGASVDDGGRVVLISGAVLQGELDGDGVLGTVRGAAGEGLGLDVAMVGDTNGDGLSDVLIGASDADEPFASGGRAVLVLGQLGGWTDSVPLAASWAGVSEYSRVGSQVVGPGDLDGDGLAELAITGERSEWTDYGETRREGRVYLFYGRSEWVSAGAVNEADVTWDGEGPGHAAGQEIAGGDLDGDGSVDLVIGAPYAWAVGRAYVIRGGSERMTGGVLSEATVALGGESYNDAFGWSVTTGDIDGDGVDDLAVGVPLSDRSWPGAGAVFIYAGGPEFFAGSPEPLAVFTGEFDDHQLGYGLSAGDMDGDGAAELSVGAINAWSGLLTKAGRVYLIRGRESGWPEQASVTESGQAVYGAGVNERLGRATVLADMDVDGRADLFVTSPHHKVGENLDTGIVSLFWGL